MLLMLSCSNVLLVLSLYQGCSLGLEPLGFEMVSRRFFERLGLVSVLTVERLGLGLGLVT